MSPLAILGSTGSIGTQALDVVRALPQRLSVVALAAGGGNLELFAQQVTEFAPLVAALHNPVAAQQLRDLLPHTRTRIVSGPEGLREVASLHEAAMVLTAMSGAAGLEPTLAAIESGKDVAIANKETLVAAGELVTRRAREQGVRLLPVDSEHSALAQCLAGEQTSSVERLTITASGGPFVDMPRAEMAGIQPAQALKHPTWTMGRKITVDSATLMNKALEIIEAFWLFEVPMERIEVVVHRQSIVHSFVTLRDGSVKAQLGVPDMKLPIQWALLRGEREPGPAPRLDLAGMGKLTFEPVDEARFPAVRLAQAAMAGGGALPCALNAANEEAVGAFLEGRLSFPCIYGCIESVLERTAPASGKPCLELDDIRQADAQARRLAQEYIAT